MWISSQQENIEWSFIRRLVVGPAEWLLGVSQVDTLMGVDLQIGRWEREGEHGRRSGLITEPADW